MAPLRLSGSQRADITVRLLGALFQRDWTDIDAILTAFKLPGLDLEEPTDYPIVHAECRASLAGASDTTLVELAQHVLGETVIPETPSSHALDSADDLWGAGTVRIFLSHLATERALVGEVSADLSRIGLSSFVAHDNIEVTQEWQYEIERALRTADVLAGLAHPSFYESYWTQQEIGWALGREIPVVLIGLGEPPRGFPARVQAPMLGAASMTQPWRVASAIALWLTRDERWKDDVVAGLVHDLQSASSYSTARDAATRLQEVGALTQSVLDGIEHAYRSNDQLYPYHVGARVVEEILKSHGRTLPRDAPFLGPSRVAKTRRS